MGGAGREDRVFVAPREIGVLAEADLVVAGASFAGCAAALSAARAGLRVVVVEPRTFPGREASAPHRPWLDAGVLNDPPALLAPWIAEASRRVAGQRDAALKPDAMKRGLEDALLGAGVSLVYSAYPVGVVREGGRVAGLVVAGKFGRRAVLARAVADATEWALVARFAGAPAPRPSSGRALSCAEGPAALRRPLPAAVRAWRTLEFTGVGPGGPGGGNQGTWREGFLGPDHRLLEAPMDLTLPSADLTGLMAAEIEARRRTVELVERLRRTVPALRAASFAHAGYELAFPSPWVVTGGEIAVLSSAAAQRDDEAEGWLDPAEAARRGEAAAAGLVKAARRTARPSPRRCVAACGSPASLPRGRPVAVKELPPPEGVATIRTRAETVPVLAGADVLVAGGGTAGAVAAAVAGAAGARTVLVEMHGGLGGTGTIGGVNTYWFGRKTGFTAEVNRRYRAVAARLGATPAQTERLEALPASGLWHVEAKMHALLAWSLEAGVTPWFWTAVTGALVQGRALRGAVVAGPDGLAAVRAAVTVESTGDGDLAAHAGAAVVHGGARDGIPMFWSLPPVPRPGAPTNSFAAWARVDDPMDSTRAVLAGRRRFMGYDHGPYHAPRESRHVTGACTVTLRDHFVHRRRPDAICVCHDGRDIKGPTSADWAWWGAELGKVDAEIPYRAVVPARLDGLLVGSKAYSATHEGLSLARMQADMQNLGGAMGLAAAMATAAGVQPRRLPVRALQRELVRRGALPPDVPSRRIAGDGAPRARDIPRLVAGLTGRELDYDGEEWMRIERAPQPVALLCAAGRRALPALAAAYRTASGPRRFLLARILAWNESRLGSDELLHRLEAELPGGRLQERHPRKGPPPPDNTGMPLACRLIYTLGLAREPRLIPVMERVAAALEGSTEQLARHSSGEFYCVQAICLAAERIAVPAAVPALLTLHAKPGLHHLGARTFQPGIWDERSGYLEVALGRAMARCGAVEGARILAGYLDDARAYLVAHARSELAAVTGRDLGPERKVWERFLAGRRSLRPRRWLHRGE